MDQKLPINSENRWKEIKNIFTDTPKELLLDELTYWHEGRLSIIVDGVKFDSCFIKNNPKKIIVFISGPGRKDYDHPAFWRKSYSTYFEDSCLYIDDPCNIQKKFAPTYFWGDSKMSYMDCVVHITKKFQEVYGIENKDVVFIGCSNTGFVGLYCAACIEHSLCISLSPQVNIRMYLEDNKLLNRFRNLFNYDFNDYTLDSRINIVDKILENKTSKFFITSNITCFFDKDQMEYFFAKAGRVMQLGLNTFDNKYVYISDFPVKRPHHFLPDESYCRHIYNFLKKEDLTDKDYYDFNSLNKSLYWYFYEQDRADGLNESLKKVKTINNIYVDTIQRKNFKLKKKDAEEEEARLRLRKIENELSKKYVLLEKYSSESQEKDATIAAIIQEIEKKNARIAELEKANEEALAENREMLKYLDTVKRSRRYILGEKLCRILRDHRFLYVLLVPIMALVYCFRTKK